MLVYSTGIQLFRLLLWGRRRIALAAPPWFLEVLLNNNKESSVC